MKAVAKLRGHAGSPRKIRLVADIIRGKDVTQALNILKFTRRHSARPMEKLLLSAIANWREKNTDKSLETTQLYISKVCVDGARVLKRFRPAPYGRAHRIRKHYSHITIEVNDKGQGLFGQVMDIIEDQSDAAE